MEEERNRSNDNYTCVYIYSTYIYTYIYKLIDLQCNFSPPANWCLASAQDFQHMNMVWPLSVRYRVNKQSHTYLIY